MPGTVLTVGHDTGGTLSALAGAELTYPEVGATRDGALPDGYGHVSRDVPIGTGRAVFERAADGLRLRIRAVSRPASIAARWGWTLTRLVPRYATDRYCNAMQGKAAVESSM